MNGHGIINITTPIVEHNTIKTGTRVYCDGSGTEGKIGAAAVLYTSNPRPKVLRYHLGTADKWHTVYEAEAVGLTLAARLLLTQTELELPVSIFVDNQAAIKSGATFTSKSGNYLIDHFSRIMRAVRKKHNCRREDITLRLWIAGHEDIEGNEAADEEAKQVMVDPLTSSAVSRLPIFLRGKLLPLSISAAKQRQDRIKKERWERIWAGFPRYAIASSIDKKMLAGSFLKTTAGLTRQQTSLLVWIRTKHSPLNAHLHRIKRADTPYSAGCPNEREDVKHYLLLCPLYARQHAILQEELRRDAFNISRLRTTWPAV